MRALRQATGFTPLESPAFQSGDEINKNLHTLLERAGFKVPSFLTGFTLVEIMVVVAILVIILTMAIPRVIRSRVIAGEGIAITSIKTISHACQVYSMNNERYPENLTNLTTPDSDPPYIDSNLASGQKAGYDFEYATRDTGFDLRANPGGTLRVFNARYFYTNETDVLRFKYGGPAGPDDEIYGKRP